jgi:hypothetical protein
VQSTAVKDVSIWVISNPQLNVKFERRSASLLTLASWVDVNSLEERDGNAVQEVCQRGFRMAADKPLALKVGAISFDDRSQVQHQYLLCNVAVGRSFVQDGPDAERKLPPGYDSLYLHDAAASAPGAYQHQYAVFDPSQVVPRYVVHFTLDPSVPQPRTAVGEIDLEALKARIGEALSVLGPAASAATEKMLSDIGEAYDKALTASSEPDALLETRKSSVADALRMVDDKLAAIQANSKAVEDALYACMQEAIFSLQDATQKKMNALLSEELELRRQAGQIAWLESFAGVMQTTLPPMTFISAWERHVAARAALYPSLGGKANTRGLDDIVADLSVVGTISVVTASAAAKAAAAPAAAVAVPASTGAAGANMNDILTSILKAQLGGSAAAASSTSTGSVPIITVDQARANYERAVADMAAIDATAVGLPLRMKAQGEAARTQAAARLSEAESIYTAHAARAAAGVPTVVAGSPTAASSPRAGGASAAKGQGATTTTTVGRAAAAPAASVPHRITAPLEQRLARFSLSREADRKRRQRGLDSLDPGFAFPDSAILGSEQAMGLYMCLPWGVTAGAEDVGASVGLGSAPPLCRLLFSSSEDAAPPTVTSLVTAYAQQGGGEATVLLVRANGYVFGGYAADPWDMSEYYGGTPRCFLFSITRDVRIPFTGRVRGPRQANDELLMAAHEQANELARAEFDALCAQAKESTGQEPTFDEAGRLVVTQYNEAGVPEAIRIPMPRAKAFIRNDALRSGPELLQFGLRDLVLRGDFSHCSSELENSYGLGLRADEAAVLLAGGPSFRAESVELWALSPTGAPEGFEEPEAGSYATPMH